MIFKSFVEAILHLGKIRPDTIQDSNKRELLSEIQSWTKFFDGSHVFMTRLIPCTFIFDYKKGEIIYFSPSVLDLIGIEHTTLLGSTGIIRFMDIINPNDFKV